VNGVKHVFVLGPVAVMVQHWEERFSELEAGARVEVRRVEPAVGERDRPGAAGFRVMPVSEGGIWRADLFVVVDPPGREPRYHHHPRFAGGDVGPRVFDPDLAADPAGWTEARLADLPALLRDCGAADLAPAVDAGHVAEALPAIRAAIAACLTR
jgi:hypothetical protein